MNTGATCPEPLMATGLGGGGGGSGITWGGGGGGKYCCCCCWRGPLMPDGRC